MARASGWRPKCDGAGKQRDHQTKRSNGNHEDVLTTHTILLHRHLCLRVEQAQQRERPTFVIEWLNYRGRKRRRQAPNSAAHHRGMMRLRTGEKRAASIGEAATHASPTRSVSSGKGRCYVVVTASFPIVPAAKSANAWGIWSSA